MSLYSIGLSEKWVARYTNQDGSKGMGIGNHVNALPNMVMFILKSGGRNIVITDETIRPNIIEGEVKIVEAEGVNHEQRSEVHTGTIRHSSIEEHQ